MNISHLGQVVGVEEGDNLTSIEIDNPIFLGSATKVMMHFVAFVMHERPQLVTLNR